MNLKTQKIAAGVLIGVVVIAGGCDYWQKNKPYDITAGWSDVQSEDDVIRYAKSLINAYEKDTVGFATPEETFDAFRGALKAGNYELAAQYFVPEKQSEMLRLFKIGVDNGAIHTQVNHLYLPNKKIILNDEEVRFRADDEKDSYSFSYDLVKNTYTNIWKMSEL